MIPAELFSWQSVVLGGQVVCCGAGIVLVVFSGGSAPLLLAGFGLAITIADIASLIYHRKHGLPMGQDSIANAVYLISYRFLTRARARVSPEWCLWDHVHYSRRQSSVSRL